MRLRIVNSSVAVLVLGAVLAGALSLTALAGCGGSSSSKGNGVASKSPQQIVEQSSAAAKGAKSVHVAGAFEGAHITLDLDLVAGKGGRGEVSQNGLRAKIIVIGKTAYINGDAAFYRHFDGKAGAQLFEGKWLKASTSNQDIASLSSLANMGALLASALNSHGTLKKGSTTSVNGQPAITVQDTSESGSLYVATTGKPYPLQLAKTGSEGGKITFDRWDEPVELAAPAQAVDVSELEAAKH